MTMTMRYHFEFSAGNNYHLGTPKRSRKNPVRRLKFSLANYVHKEQHQGSK